MLMILPTRFSMANRKWDISNDVYGCVWLVVAFGLVKTSNSDHWTNCLFHMMNKKMLRNWLNLHLNIPNADENRLDTYDDLDLVLIDLHFVNFDMDQYHHSHFRPVYLAVYVRIGDTSVRFHFYFFDFLLKQIKKENSFNDLIINHKSQNDFQIKNLPWFIVVVTDTLFEFWVSRLSNEIHLIYTHSIRPGFWMDKMK